jgi:hypothetical protein
LASVASKSGELGDGAMSGDEPLDVTAPAPPARLTGIHSLAGRCTSDYGLSRKRRHGARAAKTQRSDHNSVRSLKAAE